MSPTYFEPRGFIFREKVENAAYASPMHVKYTILHIQLFPWGRIHEVRNILETPEIKYQFRSIVHFVGLCCIITSQYKVKKHKKLIRLIFL